MHVHAASGKGEAKFWLEPQIEMVKNHGYNLSQLHEITNLIEEHRHEFIDSWQHYFGS